MMNLFFTIRKTFTIAFAAMMCSFPGICQDFTRMTKEERQAYFAKIAEVSASDHRKMMTLLNIDSLRPGANGMDPNAANAANYDESKANPFPELPNPLMLNNGKIVRDKTVWWKTRRAEIIAAFDAEVYGKQSENIPAVRWTVISIKTEMEGLVPVVVKKLIGRWDHSSDSTEFAIDLTLVTPANSKSKVPVMMELSFNFPPGFLPPDSGPSWKQQILSKGWGFAVLIPTSFQADNGAGLTKGIIGFMNNGKSRQPTEWGTLKAWAWGASRALDYFETDPAVDEKKIGIAGHSRYGKAAAVAMAYDQRFAIGFISSSGEGGLKLHRRNFGEIVENVASSGEYHWMAGNFLKYAGPLTWNDLPVDAHHLIALCAPRPIFIGCGSVGDNWVDPRGMFLAAVGAGPVYKLLGAKDLGTNSYPPINQTLSTGDIAFRQHDKGHTPAPNWESFLNFAARYFQ